MADQSSQEPTMEEILASIRRIISDDEPAAGPAHAEAPAHPAPVVEAEPAPFSETVTEEEDILDLTERVDEPHAAVESHGDLDVYTAEAAHEPPPAPAPAPVHEPAPVLAAAPPLAASVAEHVEGLVGRDAASASASHFGMLHQHIAMPPAGLTLDEVVRDLLRPLLKEWLDTHLPDIVQATVQQEVERIARRNVR